MIIGLLPDKLFNHFHALHFNIVFYVHFYSKDNDICNAYYASDKCIITKTVCHSLEQVPLVQLWHY